MLYSVSSNNTYLSQEEREQIAQNVKVKIVKILAKMSLVGGVANIVSGLIFILIIHEWASPIRVSAWYALLLISNLYNIFLNYYYKNKLAVPKPSTTWRISYLIVFTIICLTWGSITLLFLPPNANYHLAILAFLLAVVIGFSFPSIFDFTLAIISICCLLLPTIVFYLYQIFKMNNLNYIAQIDIGISSSLFILGLFLLIITFISSGLVMKFFKLSFTNALLSYKLEQINQSLELRVKERIELEKKVEQVTYRATHDILTNLPNNRSLITFLKTAIKLSRQQHFSFAVIFFSLNEIDRVYNALGYVAGDYVINSIANRFKQKYGEIQNNKIEDHNYIVTLFRNDVFVIIFKPIYDLNVIEDNIKQLFDLVEEPVYAQEQVIKLTASIGISLYPRNGRNISSLLMNADAAMLLAKQFGGNVFKMYKAEINYAITKQLELESRLHSALINTEFTLHYQPIVDLKSGMILGAEALVRWENPSLGRIPPDSFIPIAEANGIIIPLGEWVLRAVCQQTSAWHQMGFSTLKTAVNLSPKQLRFPTLISSILTILKENNLDPKYIEFELTESAAVQEDLIPILNELKALGFSLSIDDFGTRYSGLTNIKRFSIDKIKIDKSFIHDIANSSGSRAIVTNIIDLAKTINVEVVAEGVETKEQLIYLIKKGCNMAQGYLFSRPVEAPVFAQLMREKGRLFDHTDFL